MALELGLKMILKPPFFIKKGGFFTPGQSELIPCFYGEIVPSCPKN